VILTQQLILGVLVGGLYGLAAAGLSLTFGVLRVLNVAHGELLMLGGYGTFWLFTLWRIDPFLSLLGVGPALFVLGLVLYWTLFQFVVKAHEEVRIKNSLLIGFGLTWFFTLWLFVFGLRRASGDHCLCRRCNQDRRFAIPLVRLSSLVLPLLLTALHLFLAKARWGWRFERQPKIEAAALMGIPVGRLIFSLLPWDRAGGIAADGDVSFDQPIDRLGVT
jgi:branched-chain amino acid transport system permease protein